MQCRVISRTQEGTLSFRTSDVQFSVSRVLPPRSLRAETLEPMGASRSCRRPILIMAPLHFENSHQRSRYHRHEAEGDHSRAVCCHEQERQRERERESVSNYDRSSLTESSNKTLGWAFLPGDFDRSPCPGERERECVCVCVCLRRSLAVWKM